MPAGDDPIVTAEELGAALGISARHVRTLRDAGTLEQEGKRFRLRHNIQRYLAHRLENATPDGARDRLAKLKADDLEMDLAERRGDLVHIAAVQEVIDALADEVRARRRGIGQRIAHEIGADQAAADTIQARVDQLLEELAQASIDVGSIEGTTAGLNGHDVGGHAPDSLA
jgi:phage terminase Nu1 subunit (DNA packaging protein)